MDALITIPTPAEPDSAFGPVREVRSSFVAGLDLGQKQDHTALTIIERQTVTYTTLSPVTWQPHQTENCILGHLARLSLNLPYPEIVEHVRHTLMLLPPGAPVTLVVDATGVGAPVVDLLRARGLGRNLVPVTITGAASGSHTSDGQYRVPKRDLITGLQVAFETRSLTIAAGLGGIVEALITELTNMRREITDSANERYGVWRSGLHDDLVLATSLAWWGMSRHRNRQSMWGTRRLL